MDELALLRDFRLEDAAPNGAREHARQVLGAAIARRRSRRRRTVALAFLAAVVLAGAAYGIARGLIVGEPAPEEIKQQLARFGHEAELIPYPHPDDPRVEEARVAAASTAPLVLRTSSAFRMPQTCAGGPGSRASGTIEAGPT